MDLLDVLPKFRQMAVDAGRKPDDLPITNFGPPLDVEMVAKNVDAGVDRIVVSVGSEKADAILSILDRVAEFAARNPD